MKKPLIIVSLTNLFVVGFLCSYEWRLHSNDIKAAHVGTFPLQASFGVLCLGIGIYNILGGLVLILLSRLYKPCRNYGLAAWMAAGVLFLSSLTLCTVK